MLIVLTVDDSNNAEVLGEVSSFLKTKMTFVELQTMFMDRNESTSEKTQSTEMSCFQRWT